MHRAEAAAQGTPFEYRMINIDSCDDLPGVGALVDRVEVAGYDGINVTFPCDQAVIAHLTRRAMRVL